MHRSMCQSVWAVRLIQVKVYYWVRTIVWGDRWWKWSQECFWSQTIIDAICHHVSSRLPRSSPVLQHYTLLELLADEAHRPKMCQRQSPQMVWVLKCPESMASKNCKFNSYSPRWIQCTLCPYVMSHMSSVHNSVWFKRVLGKISTKIVCDIFTMITFRLMSKRGSKDAFTKKSDLCMMRLNVFIFGTFLEKNNLFCMLVLGPLKLLDPLCCCNSQISSLRDE